MEKSEWRNAFILFVVLLAILNTTEGQRKKVNKTTNIIPVTEVDYKHRIVNWCVTGQDEPEFLYYPYNELVPYIQKTQLKHHRVRDKTGKPRYDYTMELVDVKFEDKSAAGSDPNLKGTLLNTAHAKFQAYKLREHALGIKERLEPVPFEGLVVQVNHAPLGIGFPYARFVDIEEEVFCSCVAYHGISVGCRKRPKYEIMHPSVLVWHRHQGSLGRSKTHNNLIKSRREYVQKVTGLNQTAMVTVCKLGPKWCDPEDYGSEGQVPKGELPPENEVHGTLQWYYPPCTVTRAVEFIVIVVHSFEHKQFDTFFLGPYELPDISGSRTSSRMAPTPFFYGMKYSYVCDDIDDNTGILSEADRSSRITYPFDYSYNYDICVVTGSDPKQMCQYPDHASCVDAADKAFVLRADKCSRICESEMPSTSTAKPVYGPLFRRNLHGAINMITNFCLQPIFIFIGRYYKETFNLHSYKGAKLWYWIHLIGGAIASIFQYFGYFHPHWVNRGNQHYIAGNIMIMMLGICYASSWIRHRNAWWTRAAEFFHGASGYVVSGLAFWCLHTAPHVPATALILIYTATGLLVFGYIMMECCIFWLDRKFGMRPYRRHFPTVEARFDDLPVPGRKWRIGLLIFLTITMLILTTLTIFIE